MELYEYTVHELMDKLEKKEITITELTKAYVDRINEKEKDVEAFVTTLTDEAISKSQAAKDKW